MDLWIYGHPDPQGVNWWQREATGSESREEEESGDAVVHVSLLSFREQPVLAIIAVIF